MGCCRQTVVRRRQTVVDWGEEVKRQRLVNWSVSKSDPKEHSIRVRLSGEDFADLEFVAEQLQIPLSTCLRMHALEALRTRKNDLFRDATQRKRHQDMLKQQLEDMEDGD